MSRTERPVTQVAEVDMKKASIQESGSDCEAHGSFKSRVPPKIAAAKLNKTKCPGLKVKFF